MIYYPNNGGNNMNLRILEYFLTLAREENISAAAEFLHITQPTLSRQLIELENELGTKLFIRGNRKITLTEDGILFRKRAEEIVALVQKTESEFSAPNDIISGDIYIGGGETESMRLIAHLAYDIQKENPNIRFHIYSGNADDVTERLDKGLLDFGVLIEPANTSKYDVIPLPTVDSWGVLMRKDSPLANKSSLQSDDLQNLPLITSRQAMVDKAFTKWLGKNYNSLNIVATYNLLYNATLLVEEGMGYALALDKLANTSDESLLCFKPLEPRMEASLNFVWKKYQVFSKASELFLKCLQNTFITSSKS